MAISSYIQFTNYKPGGTGSVVKNPEGKVDTKGWTVAGKSPEATTLFEIEDWSFDIEQTLNIGSQSSGAGAGKVTFNPFQITRKVDSYSVDLFEACCSGTPYQFVQLFQTKSGGGANGQLLYLTYHFKLVAVKAIGWSGDGDSPRQIVDFAYGGLVIEYHQQDPSGTLLTTPNTLGWNRVTNSVDKDFNVLAK